MCKKMIEKHVSAILQNRKSSVQRIKNCIAFCTILLNLSVPTSISTISKSDKDYLLLWAVTKTITLLPTIKVIFLSLSDGFHS